MSDNKSSIDQIVEMIQGLVGLILLGGAVYFIFFDTDETEEVKNPTEEYISPLEEKEVNIEKEFIGTYTATDALGFTFTLDIKSDKKATLKSGRKTWYGIWDFYFTKDYIYIDMSSGPKIYTNIEYGLGPMYFIKNGYFYNNSTDCEAENPEKRLRLN